MNKFLVPSGEVSLLSFALYDFAQMLFDEGQELNEIYISKKDDEND